MDVFRRRELKFLIATQQRRALEQLLKGDPDERL